MERLALRRDIAARKIFVVSVEQARLLFQRCRVYTGRGRERGYNILFYRSEPILMRGIYRGGLG